jgi:hypothetical protein
MKLMPALSMSCLCFSVCLGAASLIVAPAQAADPAPDASSTPPCGKLVGQGAAASGDGGGFDLRDGEAVDFVSGGQTTHGRLLVFHDGSLFRAYWQPEGSEEKYALANAGPHSVRLISTPPQGAPARNGRPGVMTQPLLVLSCPKL